MKQRHIGVFFDRDGTLNTEIDFVRKPEELKFIPKSINAVREENESGVKVFIITNQSGIARGFLSEADLSAAHTRLRDLLKRKNAHIDGIYYCPHHREFGKPPYNITCNAGYGTKERDECVNTVGVDYVVDNAYDAWLGIKSLLKHSKIPSA